MKRLILLRHAKSAWDEPGLVDRERPLNERGRDAAPRLGAYMLREGLVPERAVVSPARRTRETWALASSAWTAQPDVTTDERLYDATVADLLRVIGETDESVASLLVVAHNPGLEVLAAKLARRERSSARQSMTTKFPTGGLAVLDVPADSWAELHADTAHLERFVTPRSIGAADVDD